ncbi:hypothetical protein ACNKHT_23220 [Shigella flexneri]
MPAQTAPPTTANLNAWLNNFYNAEAKRNRPSRLRCPLMLSHLNYW